MDYHASIRQKNIAKWRIAEITSTLDGIEHGIGGVWNTAVTTGRFQNLDDTYCQYLDIVMASYTKALLSMRAVISLTADGYPDGVYAVARNIYELMISLIFFEQHRRQDEFLHYVNDYCADYDLRWHEIQLNRPSCQNREEIESTYAVLKSNNPRYKHNRNYWWAGVNSFYDLYNLVGNNISEDEKRVHEYMHRLYKEACIAMHANRVGNIHNLGKCDVNYDARPREEGFNKPLCFALESFRCIAAITANVIGASDIDISVLSEYSRWCIRE